MQLKLVIFYLTFTCCKGQTFAIIGFIGFKSFQRFGLLQAAILGLKSTEEALKRELKT